MNDLETGICQAEKTDKLQLLGRSARKIELWNNENRKPSLVSLRDTIS